MKQNYQKTKYRFPFVGREQELQLLETLLAKKTASLVVITGRRRIGKSRLVEEFAKDKHLIRFSGLFPTEQTTADTQKEEFSRQFAENNMISPKASDWGDMLYYLGQATKEGRYIIFFDEISWMGTKDPAFLGKLKNAWDHYFSKNPQLILILCGSVASWIENNIIRSTGFLGRISRRIHLDELSLNAANQLLYHVGFRGSVFEILVVLSITGGIPWYIENIDSTLPLSQMINQLCFEPNGLFVSEFQHIFHDLYGRRREICKHILISLNNGPKDMKQIAEAVHLPLSGALSNYLSDLEVSGFIKRYFTWNMREGNYSKLSRYRIRDNYTRFYLKYIEPNLQKIKENKFHQNDFLSLPGWSNIMGLHFENLVLKNSDTLIDILKLNKADIVLDGPYFQKQTKQAKGCQIDYMIQTKTNTLYVCEVKFSKKPIGKSVIVEMKEKLSNLSIPKGFACVPVLIHVSGVDESLEEEGYFYKIIDFSSLLLHSQ